MPQLWSNEGERASPGRDSHIRFGADFRINEKAFPCPELDIIDVHLLEIAIARSPVTGDLPFRVHDYLSPLPPVPIWAMMSGRMVFCIPSAVQKRRRTWALNETLGSDCFASSRFSWA